jgi:hypothetical protein
MIVEPFTMLDYVHADMANGIGLEHWNLKGGIVPVLKSMEASGTFWTVKEGAEVWAIAGYHQFFNGVVEVSFFPTKKFVMRPRAILKVLRVGVKDLAGRYHRIQAHCRVDVKFIRFAKSFGFESEGVMRKFGLNNADHMMLAIVR